MVDAEELPVLEAQLDLAGTEGVGNGCLGTRLGEQIDVGRLLVIASTSWPAATGPGTT